MSRNLFVTGATGFIGQNFLRSISGNSFQTIYCLSRKSFNLSLHPSIQFIQGDLFDGDCYCDALHETDAVLHLAAATGKHTPETYFHVNTIRYGVSD